VPSARLNEPLAQPPEYVLRLFITGTSSRSVRAVANLHRICESHLHGHYDLEVIDIHQQPELARENEVLASPTLIKRQPLPLRLLVGDMSNEEKVLAGLSLPRELPAGEAS
jgi:circadian clock protein KaiB